ncbi:DMT family transporter [Erythrobacter mangrovi]|uniref:EamA family transporter n=1 Tax=Erythrobacter mangrovi TaxID=2739433 RepID=A0A7D3XJ36_9SPHN|nr:DMT family transporter [Erythrobacter mangrovi]QKG71739.1 EamA family transporter [Erythrobacter mangrovi]
MNHTVFLAVIGAALLHALWNAVVKSGSDKLVGMGAVVIGHAPLALVAVLLAPTPDVASLPYLAAGVALHFGYQLFLLHSYRLGDLTQVYPIARGSAPLMVAAVSVIFLGVTLGTAEIAAIALISLGILSLAIVQRADGTGARGASWLALATGGFIASYSLVDGTGAQLAGTSFGFYGWLALINAALMAAFLIIRSPDAARTVAQTQKRVALLGGGASFAAYALVTWAFTQSSIALVAALRETSIVFAMLIGVFFLKEKVDLKKLVATSLTLAGAFALRIAR